MSDHKKIRVEGITLAKYLQETICQFDPALEFLKSIIEDGGGFAVLDKYIKDCGDPDSVFVVYDGDVLKDHKLNTHALKHLENHLYKIEISQDFEWLFPAWMHVEALQVYRKSFCEITYPDEKEIDSCFIEGRKQWKKNLKMSIYEQVKMCVENYFKKEGQDPALHLIPNKTSYARCLTVVSNRTWYQPPGIRCLIRDIATWAGYPVKLKSLIKDCDAVESGLFRINRNLADHLGLKGRLAIRKSHEPNNRGDLWVLDIGDYEAEDLIVKDDLEGPPVWSHDGLYIAMKMHQNGGDKRIGIYNYSSGKVEKEYSRLGHQDGLCWDKQGNLYGSGANRQIYRVGPESDKRAKPMNFPPCTLIITCVDRARSRILFGNQNTHNVEFYKINQTTPAEPLIPPRSAGWGIGSCSPNGKYVALACENIIDSRKLTLWVLNTDERDSPQYATELTPPEGAIGTCCWLNNENVLFMWIRYKKDNNVPEDDVRLWIANIHTGELNPFIEGFNQQDLMGAISCHSWYPRKIG